MRRAYRPYCRGPKMGQCKRREYKLTNGTPPAADVMPDGNTLGQ
jgi:hypothetical protein